MSIEYFEPLIVSTKNDLRRRTIVFISTPRNLIIVALDYIIKNIEMQ